MWTLRILKEPIKYQTIGGFLFRLFGVSRRSEQFYCFNEKNKRIDRCENQCGTCKKMKLMQ